MSTRTFSACIAAAFLLAGSSARGLAAPAAGGPGSASASDAKEDYKAADMLKKGIEMLELGQEERGVKMVASVPTLFPKSRVRFDAHMTLGRHYMDKGDHTLAIKQFRMITDGDAPDKLAEALFRVGVCHYNLANYDQASMMLRQVTTDHASSVFANDAYYYIGLCYFKAERWAKAVEALKLVGTSVTPDAQGDTLAEAGQRLFVRVFDKDLVVLKRADQKLTVRLETQGGDREEIAIEALDRTGEYYIGSIETVLGETRPGDGNLQITGRDTVKTSYVDTNTESGKTNAERLSQVHFVSTASLGFTDGAFREYTRGVFGGGECFLRLRDLDLDLSGKYETVPVTLITRYRVQAEEGDAAAPADEAAPPEYQVRDSVTLTLNETGPHTGTFTGTLVPALAASPADVVAGDATLSAMNGDEILVQYTDQAHIQGMEPREVVAVARLLTGQMQDVKVEHRVVDTPDLKARKNLIEAKLYLKLGEIFKDVGLLEKATEKAAEGLARTDEIISMNLRNSLDRSIVEEAFSVKWNLLLVQDNLAEAIRVCQTLIRLYPDSALADEALFKIGVAKQEEEDYVKALQLFGAVMAMGTSELRPEAQFKIAQIHEVRATEAAKTSQRPPDLTAALKAYQKCAEEFPQSPFAGDALEKIANYYLSTQDYTRAIELVERIFQDYPDAAFLDKMLLKWAFVAYKMGNYPLARQKAEQVIAEYPGSKEVENARKLLPLIEKQSQSGG